MGFSRWFFFGFLRFFRRVAFCFFVCFRVLFSLDVIVWSELFFGVGLGFSVAYFVCLVVVFLVACEEILNSLKDGEFISR